jgi:hypothetical protein
MALAPTPDPEGGAEAGRAPDHVLRRLEQDAGLVAGDRGGVALGAALALDEGEVEPDRRGQRGLAVAARHVDHRLPEAPVAVPALDEAEEVGEDQLLPGHEAQRPPGLRALDVGHLPGEQQRRLDQVGLEAALLHGSAVWAH